MPIPEARDPDRLRIGLVTPGFSVDENDFAIPVLAELVRRLATRHDVVVFSLRHPPRKETYEIFGARVVPLGAGQIRGLARLGLVRRALRVIRREHTERPFDLLHAVWAHEPGFVAALAGRRLGLPVVVSLFGGELADVPAAGYGGQRELVNRLLVGWSLGRADRVTAGSRLGVEQARSRTRSEPMDPGSIVDVDRFGPEGEVRPLEGSPSLLHVASLVPVKDQETLLRAFCVVAARMPGARLHVVGEGPLRGSLEGTAASLGLGDRVRWHGAVRHDELPAVYRGADLFLLSSRFEQTGMVLLEAGACGTPVAGTTVGRLPELAGPDLLAPPGDPEALGARLLAALAAPEALAARGAALRRAVVAEHAPERVLPRWEALYRDLLA